MGKASLSDRAEPTQSCVGRLCLFVLSVFIGATLAQIVIQTVFPGKGRKDGNDAVVMAQSETTVSKFGKIDLDDEIYTKAGVDALVAEAVYSVSNCLAGRIASIQRVSIEGGECVSCFTNSDGTVTYAFSIPAGVATTQDVASAIAAIPAADMSGYATTDSLANLVSHDDLAAMDYAENEVRMRGGYATSNFWYVTASPVYDVSGADRAVGDVVVSYAESLRWPSYSLSAEPESRVLLGDGSDEPTFLPAGRWKIVSGAEYATLSNNVVLPTKVPGVAVVAYVPENDSEPERRISLPFNPSGTGSVVRGPLSENPESARGRWMASIRSLFLGSLSTPETRYRWHGDTVYDASGNSSWSVRNSLQLYKADDTQDPRTRNTGFFSPELGRLLMCQSSWRSDRDAHKPYIAVSPHYCISVKHWSQDNSSAVWCTNRTNAKFASFRFDSQPNNRSCRIGSVRDVSIHRMKDAFPESILCHFMRNEELAKVSPSYLNYGVAVTLTSHNTVHPTVVRPGNLARYGRYEEPSPWTSFVSDQSGFLSGYEDLEPLAHATHIHESGHGVYWYVDGKLILCGTFTYASGGPNAFHDGDLLDAINAAILKDSGGAEQLLEYTAADFN